MQICLHMLKYQVQIFIVFRFDYWFELNYVRVVNLMQNGDFTICSLRIDIILKGVKYFFKCKGLFGGFLDNFPDVTVSPTTEKLLNLEKLLNVFLNFFWHFLYGKSLNLESDCKCIEKNINLIW